LIGMRGEREELGGNINSDFMARLDFISSSQKYLDRVTKQYGKSILHRLIRGMRRTITGTYKVRVEGIFAVEKTPDAFLTLQHNLIDGNIDGFEWPSWLECKEMTTSDLLLKHKTELKNMRGKIDLIAGGPPCQGFSFAGRRNPSDPRNKLTEEYIELVNLIRPKYLLLENVKGFKTAFKGTNEPAYSHVVEQTLKDLKWGGYVVFSSMLNASMFGVPQPRARFIMIAVRSDIALNELTSPFEKIDIYAQSFRDDRQLNGHQITVKEAISDLEVGRKKVIESEDTKGFMQIRYREPKNMTSYQALMRDGMESEHAPNSLRMARHRPETIKRFKEILVSCPKGKSLSKNDRVRFNMKKQCFTPLHPDQISRAITTLPDDLLHYKEPRILTVRENARLQSFPDWFEFRGKYTTGGARRKEECPRYTQVGNAVPPLMAEALGSRIAQFSDSVN